MEALEALEEIKIAFESNPGTKIYADIIQEHLISPIEQALKRNEPMKPIYEEGAFDFRCPSCKELIHEEGALVWDYCPNCGQKLDWEDILKVRLGGQSTMIKFREILSKVKVGERIAIHTPTVEQFNTLMVECEKRDVRWWGFQDNYKATHQHFSNVWSGYYLERTCICINHYSEARFDLTYSPIEFYVKEEHKIIPFAVISFD